MAPFAFCTNPSCGRVFDFGEGCNETDRKCQRLAEPCECGDERRSRPSVLPPSACPRCNSKVVAWCPRCMVSIPNIPKGDAPKCAHCGAELSGPVEAKPARIDNAARRVAVASD